MSVTIYDDHDPIIKYDPSNAWIRGGLPEDLDGTSTFTDTSSGTTASITFKGVQIRVFGTIPLVTPKTTTAYSIDGGAPTLFTASFTPGSNGNSSDGWIFRQNFFTSGNLAPDVSHTLVISQTTNTNTRYVLDYIEVVASSGATTTSSPSAPSPNPPNPNTTTTKAPGTTTSTPGTTASAPGTTNVTGPPAQSISPTSTPSAGVPTTSNSSSTFINSPSLDPTGAQSAAAEGTTLPAVSTPSSSKTSVALIVGATIGALGIIALCGVSYLLWRHLRLRKRKAAASSFMHHPPEVRPFSLDPEYHDTVTQSTTQPSLTPMMSQTASSNQFPMSGKSHEAMTEQQDYSSVAGDSQSRYSVVQSHYLTSQPPPPQYER